MISNIEKMGMRKPPLVFTEQGVAMLSSVLNSDRAIMVNIRIIRVFTRLQGMVLFPFSWLPEYKTISFGDLNIKLTICKFFSPDSQGPFCYQSYRGIMSFRWKSNKNSFFWKPFMNSPYWWNKITVTRNQHCHIILILVSVNYYLSSNINISHFFVIDRPDISALPTFNCIALIIAIINSDVNRLKSFNISGLPLLFVWIVAYPTSKVLNSTQFLVRS